MYIEFMRGIIKTIKWEYTQWETWKVIYTQIINKYINTYIYTKYKFLT